MNAASELPPALKLLFCRCIANRAACRLKQALDFAYSAASVQEEVHEYFPRLKLALADARLASDVLFGAADLTTPAAVQLHVKALGRVGPPLSSHNVPLFLLALCLWWAGDEGDSGDAKCASRCRF
jgi:hypothetical protein